MKRIAIPWNVILGLNGVSRDDVQEVAAMKPRPTKRAEELDA